MATMRPTAAQSTWRGVPFRPYSAAEDGRGQPTALTDMILARLGYPSTEALLKGMIAGEMPAHASRPCARSCLPPRAGETGWPQT